MPPRVTDRRLPGLSPIGDIARTRPVIRSAADVGALIKLAVELRLDPARVLSRVRDLAARIPDAAVVVRRRAVRGGLRHPLVERLPDLLAGRAARCGALLARA